MPFHFISQGEIIVIKYEIKRINWGAGILLLHAIMHIALDFMAVFFCSPSLRRVLLPAIDWTILA